MSEDRAPEGVTYQDIATKYGRSLRSVQAWKARHAEFPAPLREWARPLRFDEDAVAAFVAAHIRPPMAGLGDEPEELLDIRELSAATGKTTKELWAMVAHGTFPQPVGKRRVRNGAGEPVDRWEALWRSDAAAAALEGKTARR